MKRFIFISFMVVLPLLLFAAGQQQKAAEAGPKPVYFVSTTAANLPLSPESVFKEIQENIVKLTGLKPMPYLPPKGKWVDHPCCCIAATAETLTKHPGPVKALLKVILLSTQLIRQVQRLAIADAARWTKYSEAVERSSIPTIAYVAEPTDRWLAGMETWAEMVANVKLFQGKYAAMAPKEFVADVCDLALCRAAADELRKKGALK